MRAHGPASGAELGPGQVSHRLAPCTSSRAHVCASRAGQMIFALLVAAAFALPELRPSIHWTDVTDAPLHGRHLSNEVGDAYVRRAPSDTVRLVSLHLSHPELKRRHLEDNENFVFDGAALGIVEGSEISLPLCLGGGAATFKLTKSPVMPAGLEAEFPRIRSYHGVEVSPPADRSAHTADLTVSIQGVRGQIWMGGVEGEPNLGRCHIDPHTHGRTDLYTVYHSSNKRGEPGVRTFTKISEDVHDGRRLAETFTTEGDVHEGRRLQAAALNPIWTVTHPPPVGKQNIRTLRMAVAVTFEYVFGMVTPSVRNAVWVPPQPHIHTHASMTLAAGAAFGSVHPHSSSPTHNPPITHPHARPRPHPHSPPASGM